MDGWGITKPRGQVLWTGKRKTKRKDDEQLEKGSKAG
jgi:hypothetical protein